MPTLTFPYTDGDDNQIWLKGYANMTGQTWSPTISGIPSGATINSAVLSFATGHTYEVPAYIGIYWGTSTSGTAIWSITKGTGNGLSYSIDITSYITGNMTANLYFYRDTQGVTQSNVYFTGITITVDYINPTSSFTLSSTSVAAGGTVTANISAVDSSYTHKMTVTFGSRSATVTGTNTSASYTIPLSWLDQIPNATSGTATVKIETLSGSTVLGSKTSSLTITCPSSVVPSVGTISTEVVDGHSGFYIKNASKCKVTVSGYTAGTGATVSSVYISGNGNSVYANTMTSSVLSTSGTVTFTVKITDSRGRSASGTVSINVLPYEPIKINSVGAYRCTSDGTIDVSSGTSITACCEYTMSDVDENVASVRVFWRVYGGTSWTEVSNWPDESGTWKIVLQDSAELDKQYEVRFLVADAISTTERIVTISSASIFMAWNKSKQSIGFGTYPSESQSVTISDDWTLMIGTKTIEDYVRDLVAEVLRSNGLIS